MFRRKRIDFQNDSISSVAEVVGLEFGAAVVHHQLGHALFGDLIALQYGRDATTAQDGHPVTDRFHLAKTVGNINDGDPLLAKSLHDPEQEFDLGSGKTRRRLVQYDQLVSALKKCRERYKLHLCGGKARRPTINVERDADLRKDFSRARSLIRRWDSEQAVRLVAEQVHWRRQRSRIPVPRPDRQRRFQGDGHQ